MQPPESQTELGANVFAFFVTKKTVIREILMTVLLFWNRRFSGHVFWMKAVSISIVWSIPSVLEFTSRS